MALGGPSVRADRLAEEERRALEITRLQFSRTGDGTTRLTGRLPDLAADMFKKALDGLAAPRRRSAQDGAPVRHDEDAARRHDEVVATNHAAGGLDAAEPTSAGCPDAA